MLPCITVIFFFMTIYIEFGRSLTLTRDDCQNLSTEKLYSKSRDILDAMDEEILKSGKFTHSVLGTLSIIVTESSGEDSGGGTNTQGFYTTFFFNGDSIFPAGVCENLVTQSGSGPCTLGEDNATDSFMLGSRDVISFVGCSPPPVKYFSWDSIIDVRQKPEYFFPGMNFGDDINNIMMARDGKSPFSRPVLVSHTADGKSGNVVEEALWQVLSDETITNTDFSIHTRGMDPETLHLLDRSHLDGADWQLSGPDTMSVIGRVTAPKAGFEEEYEKYKTKVFPIRFYFAQNEYTEPEEPLSPPLIPREDETIMVEPTVLGEAMIALRYAVNSTWQSNNSQYGKAKFRGQQLLNTTANGYYDDWDYMLSHPSNESFVAGTRDALYGLPKPLSEDSWFYEETCSGVIIGVLHEETQKASYASVGISLYRGALSVYGQYGTVWTQWWLNDDLRGSARRYIPDGGDEVDLLFAIDILPPGHCSSAQQPKWCVEVNNTGLPETSLKRPYWGIAERIYSLNATGIGPSTDYTIPSEFLIYDV